MACGTPVITVNHNDNAARFLIEEEKNGFICQLDEEEISKSIIKILNNSLYSEMKIYCKDFAQKYDWNKIVDEVEEVYLKMRMPESVKENILNFKNRDLENEDIEYLPEVYVNVNGERHMFDRSSVLVEKTNTKQLKETPQSRLK